jgi:hypothetical protein
MIGKPYEDPAPAFQPGDKVRFKLAEEKDGKTYTVRESDHCFTWVEGNPTQISNWRLKRVRKAKK